MRQERKKGHHHGVGCGDVTSDLSVIDLFSGVGGFSLGAARAGFNVAAAIDNDDRASAVYRKNFPGHPHFTRDISGLSASELRNLLADHVIPHGMIAGPPCQGFSRIGKRNESDPRNTLFDECFRLIAAIRPLFYIVENVLGILDSQFERLRAAGLNRVSSYNSLPPLVLKSSDYGAATSRERVFFIGYRFAL